MISARPVAERDLEASAEVLVDGLDHPEGVCWDPSREVAWAGGEGGQLYRVDVRERRAVHATDAPGFVLGVAVDGRGRVVLCCGDEGLVCVLEEGGVRTLLDGLPFPNFPAFAPDGTLYVSASGRWAEGGGLVYRFSPDGELDVLTDRLPSFPNGCAVKPDGRWLWIVESYVPTVNRVDLATGEVELITRLDGTVPDGIAFTEDGGALVSCYRPDRVLHLDADARASVVLDDPQGTLLSAPTNLAFVGAELDRLVVANLGRWHLTTCDVGLRGVPLHRPVHWAADA